MFLPTSLTSYLYKCVNPSSDPRWVTGIFLTFPLHLIRHILFLILYPSTHTVPVKECQDSPGMKSWEEASSFALLLVSRTSPFLWPWPGGAQNHGYREYSVDENDSAFPFSYSFSSTVWEDPLLGLVWGIHYPVCHLGFLKKAFQFEIILDLW